MSARASPLERKEWAYGKEHLLHGSLSLEINEKKSAQEGDD
jgi:hypothetical protein